jgi:DNA-binding beta-propeller fold protein YncE
MTRRGSRRLAASIGLLLAGAPSLAHAIEATLQPLDPIVAGEAARMRLATLDEASGDVRLYWKFGDGAEQETGPDAVVEHVYAAPGRYTVTVVARDEAGARAADSGVQKVHLPLPEGQPSHSATLVLDASSLRVWNVNADNRSVTVTQLEESGLDPLVEIPVEGRPRNLALAPDGRVWVTLQDTAEIAIVDPAQQAVVDRIALPFASQPWGIAFAPSGLAYASLHAIGEVVEIEGTAVTRSIAVGPTPAAIAITHEGRILVTRFISPDTEGQVWEIGDGEVVRTWSLPFDDGPDDESGGRGVPNYVSSIVISPDGTQAWVTAKKDNIARGPMRDGLSMMPDSFVRAVVCVLDLQTGEERIDQRIDLNNRALPMTVAFSDIGDYVFVAALGSNWIGFQNAYGTENLGGIREVGLGPDGLVLAPDGRLVAHSALSRTLQLYDVTAVLDGSDETAPPVADTIQTVIEEALPPDVLAGKQIFHNADDPRMSSEGYVACGSCHFEGGHDGRVWDFTDRGEGLRNTKSLHGIDGDGRVHWSGNFDEIQDFERDIRESFAGAGFMDEAAWAEREGDPFRVPSAGVSVALDQLAAYVLSLREVPPSPHRNEDGTLTDAARRGREVFGDAGCTRCHAAPRFTDSAGGLLHDVGTLLPTSGQRLGGPLEGIDTPSLAGLWATAPYLHDGRAGTLREIFTLYNPRDEIGVTSTLDDTELADLEAYLLQLDDTPTPDERDASGCAIDRRSNLAVILWLLPVLVRRRRLSC